MSVVRAFEVRIDEEVLDDLARRLDHARWPDEVEGAGWSYGTSLPYLQELVRYWRRDFDWREQERRLNAMPHFVATIEGLDLHFVHLRGRGPAPLPLVISHGWPSSFFEMHKIVGPLSDPTAHGADPADAFDVVVPSLPGFVFSQAPRTPGLPRVDRLWRTLMTEVLGYPRFVAHGVDVGARVTSAIGRFHHDVAAAIHLGSVDLDWPDPLPGDMTEEERDYVARVAAWEKAEGAYAAIQGTRPQTLAYGLNDSPVGLAAWIVEKYRAWSDCGGDVESRFTKDELLTVVTLYWVTQSIGSSVRRYYEARHHPAVGHVPLGERIAAPAGIAMFPGEADLVVPRSWAERCYDLRHWTDMPRGGHFAALEEPELLVADLRTYFRGVR